ncbi:hypothetical protein [Comamonas sp.]|uniref:hypothetical protein n=1 Tax=Comamonas sp. TaxID=34028 RepID=UPI0012C81223|nr:hypothetical protein [Comamonas sp.]MPS96188.1 hypothetical protein [Comamonas sp.]
MTSNPPTNTDSEDSAAASSLADAAESSLPPSTAPDRFSVKARGAFPSEEEARELASVVGQAIREFGRVFDLSRLDGVTVAEDYPQALAELDRGYKSSRTLTPTTGSVTGVAMTPAVLRDDVLKCHIVLNAYHAWPLLDPNSPNYQFSIHMIAHECAHVEITSKFDTAIPGVHLRGCFMDIRDRARQDVIFGCWDEYAATNLSARFGEDPTQGYEDNLLLHMGTARQQANDAIKAYRIDHDVEKVYNAVCRAYGNLLKYAAYYLGNLDGHGIALSQRQDFEKALSGHWFEPYFLRLEDACKDIAAQYGAWTDQSLFEVIGDILEDIVEEGGIKCSQQPDGRLYMDVPFTAATMV